jgi:hypothetical protein
VPEAEYLGLIAPVQLLHLKTDDNPSVMPGLVPGIHVFQRF